MFGISGPEFFVIILVAVIVVGPQRLPEYTRQLTRMVRQLRLFLDNARSQIAEEVGPELADLDLSSLDPRQYDPRKIVREALGEDIEAIRKDLTQPFRSVAEAAKESSEGAAKAFNEVVKPDSANSLSEQIAKKKAEAQAAKKPEPEAAEAPEAAADVATEEPADDAADDAAEAAAEETADTTAEAAADEVTESQASLAAAVPSSLEPETKLEDPSQSADASGPAGAQPLKPLSPRDIVRAANKAARTRAEAANTRL